MDITVRRASPEPDEQARPPRWPIALALVAVVAILPFLGGGTSDGSSATSASSEAAPGPPGVEPTVVTDRVPSSVGSDRLITGPALRRGPQITWQEWALPDEVTAVHAIGEIDDLVWLIASTTEPDLRGLYTGANVFSGTGAGWSERWALDPDHIVVAADVSSGGMAIASTATTLSARLPYVASALMAHASSDGEVWTSTELDAGGAAVTNIGVVAGSEQVGAWVHGVTVEAAHPDILAELPEPIADLVTGRAAIIQTTDDGVVVQGALGLELYTSAEAFEELQAPAYLPTRRAATMWRSDAYRGFQRVAEPPDEYVINLTIGTEGHLLATTADRSVLASRDGQQWMPLAETAVGAGQPVVGSVDGVPLTLHGDRVQLLSADGVEDIVLDVPGGTGFSPNVAPAAGSAGLAVLTAADGPDISITTPEASFTTASADFAFDRMRRSITVTSPNGDVVEVDVSSDGVVFEAESRELVILGTWRVPIASVERAYLASTDLDTGGPFGIAFSQNGLVWGWSPITDERGQALGPISHLSVGEASAYAVIDLPQFPTAPRTATDLSPRLLVGAVG